ncbi:MAG TPA: AI-2E family transporter [Acidisphaera sp.]|nr:AI-2E family transporter [Acidisphaera sp.]
MSGAAFIDEPVQAIAEEVSALAAAATEDTPAPVAVADNDMPLPRDPQTIFLGGLFFLALFGALHVAADIALPVVLAVVLKLLLQPLVRVTERLRVPRALGALLALVLVIGCFAGLMSALAGPAVSWAGKLPDALPKLLQQLAVLKAPLAGIEHMLHGAETAVLGPAGPSAPSAAPASSAPNIMGAVFSGTTAIAATLFTTLLVLFYLLVSGETFLRRLVEILPRFGVKRQAVEMAQSIEEHISAYLLAVTAINAVVGILTGLVMWACGVGDPLLWGVLAYLLNYIPILGPITALTIFAAASVISLGVTWAGALPVGLYFGIHVIEGEVTTPMLLARRFTINPVAVILSLVLWYWMWGVPGAVLAVPMLAITKIVCDEITPLKAFGHFLEG